VRRIGKRARAATPAAVVGVISDTHGLLRAEALAELAGVDVIVHAGDIGGPEVLEALRRIAPVIAVRGNNDRAAWAHALPEIVRTRVGGVRVCVVHDLQALRGRAASEDVEVVICGHSHQPRVERRARGLLLNPGSAGPRRFRLPIAVARLHVGPGGPRAEIDELDVAAGPPPRRPRNARRRGLDGARGPVAVSARGGVR
jgi:putative phosphoesterase